MEHPSINGALAFTPFVEAFHGSSPQLLWNLLHTVLPHVRGGEKEKKKKTQTKHKIHPPAPPLPVPGLLMKHCNTLPAHLATPQGSTATPQHGSCSLLRLCPTLRKLDWRAGK